MRNRISVTDIIKAISYDNNDHIIASVYDSRFKNISQVISTISNKGGGWLKKIKCISIKNEDKEWFDYYTLSGRKIK